MSLSQVVIRLRRYGLSWLLFLPLCLSLPAASIAASINIGNMNVSGNTLSLEVIISNGGNPVGSAGFGLTYSADRLQFMEADSTADAMNTAMPSGAQIRVGVMSMNPAAAMLTVPMRFRVLGMGPYLFAFNPTDLTDILAGVNPNRAWAYGHQQLNAPVFWSVPNVGNGNLFWVVPHVEQLTGLSLEYDGVDILAPIVSLSQWYYEFIWGTAYLVFPSISLPPGSYPLTAVMRYGQNEIRLSTTVVVQ
ncbi:MAG: hypothetical protein ABWK15_09860 [Dissulfuribacterales bacterium]